MNFTISALGCDLMLERLPNFLNGHGFASNWVVCWASGCISELKILPESPNQTKLLLMNPRLALPNLSICPWAQGSCPSIRSLQNLPLLRKLIIGSLRGVGEGGRQLGILEWNPQDQGVVGTYMTQIGLRHVPQENDGINLTPRQTGVLVWKSREMIGYPVRDSPLIDEVF